MLVYYIVFNIIVATTRVCHSVCVCVWMSVCTLHIGMRGTRARSHIADTTKCDCDDTGFQRDKIW